LGEPRLYLALCSVQHGQAVLMAGRTGGNLAVARAVDRALDGARRVEVEAPTSTHFPQERGERLVAPASSGSRQARYTAGSRLFERRIQAYGKVNPMLDRW
jgi:hypothetical protein